MVKLKPCPFCGGEAKIWVAEKGVKSIISCTTPHCGFHRHSYNNGDTDEHAALRLTTAWNSRFEQSKGVEIDQFNQWISVEDRLPEDMGDVLVWAFWHEKWGVRLGWHSQHNDGWHICTAGGDFGHIEVTHWMPLPNIAPLQSVITELHETKSDCADRK